MKQPVKWFLAKHGVFPALDLIRHVPQCAHWLRTGAGGTAPPPIKRLILKAYLKKFGLSCFIETGTHAGDTLALVAQDRKIRCTSIELSPSYASMARVRFQGYPNVEILEGDSGLLIPQVIKELARPALFWLDGHYSAGETARGSLDTPISQELAAVLSSPIKGHVILIDDIRHFNGTSDYPHLDELIKAVRIDGHYAIEVSADIARLTPNQN